MQMTKKIGSFVIAAAMCAVMAVPAFAATADAAPEKNTVRLENGLKNGLVNGLPGGLKEGLIDGLREGLINGFINGEKNGACNTAV